MKPSLYLDGFDVSTLGVRVTDPGGWRSGLPQAQRFAGLVGRIPHARITRLPESRPRTIDVEVAVEATSFSAFETAYRELLWRLDGGGDTDREIEVAFEDNPSRVYRAWWDGEQVFEAVPPHLEDRDPIIYEGRIRLAAPDARRYDTAVQNIAISSGSPATLLLWSAPVELVVDIDVDTFTLTLKDHAGATVATFGVAGAPNPPITVDFQKQRVEDSGGASVWSSRNAGSTFFVVDAQYSRELVGGSSMTLETDAGSGSVVYQRADLG